MPKGPIGEQRPADAIGLTVHIDRIATGEVDDVPEDDGKDPAWGCDLWRKQSGA